MQRVRWRVICIVAFTLVQIMASAAGQLQDSMTISEDGWRPIVGTRRQPAPYDQQSPIIQYKNPSQNNNKAEVEVIKSENPIIASSTVTPASKSQYPVPETINKVNVDNGHNLNQGEKIPPHTKLTAPGYHTIRPGALIQHHVAANAVTLSRPSQFGIKKPLIKPTPPPFFGPKRKPLRGPAASQSIRSEIYVQPPHPGFSFIKSPSNIKVREAQGLSLLGGNHFAITQPNAHIEFNRFIAPPSNDDIFQQFKSQPLYIFTKPSPAEIKKQNDEYTRNLVPPPPLRFLPEKDKKFIKSPIKFDDSIASVTETVTKLHEFGVKQPFAFRPSHIQENLVAQSAIQHDKFKLKEQAVDVQVTKEKFKVFHNEVPNIRRPTAPELINFDFHAVPAPLHPPKLQTYEVTEGKWVDNPNPFTFSFPSNTQPPNLQKLKEFQLATATPQLVTEPIVELNVPPFLPTPYKPIHAVPTSPTQSEVSTIFSQVTAKMNKYKNEALQNNPLFFDVKEVSTHFPILGKPAYVADGDNGMTTSNPLEEMTSQHSKPRRRKPQPRRPTTTTTTTTEEPVTDNAEIQKVVEEVSTETERPKKRQRIRPYSIRTSTESEEKPSHTTSRYDSEELTTEKPTRGRHRFRQRGNYASSVNADTRSTQRKRLRPKVPSTSNHKMTDADAPLTYTQSTEPYVEIQTTQTSKYSEESIQEPIVEEDIMKDQFTEIIDNPDNNKDEVEDVTENLQDTEEKNSEDVPKVGTLDDNVPINEIDYSTISPTTEQSKNEPTTTLPTTTTTELPTTTTRITRTKNKLKYSSSNRPSFSAKYYRQRLNQYTSTTPSTTTDFMRTTSEGSRFRFPSRLRTRPTPSSTTTTQSYQVEEQENTEPVIQRRRFKPKDPRHSSSTESTIIKDSNVRAVNTQLRPFNSHKPTESSVTSKISIRPHLFSTRRRPPFSFKNKFNQQNKTEEKSNEDENEVTEAVTQPMPEPENENLPDTNTEFNSNKMAAESEDTTDVPKTVVDDEDDYSKRVSDLTSSFKNEYDTPGLFKSVSPNSRRIPNYFTISTDDPILPIEAFFPNIKDREKE